MAEELRYDPVPETHAPYVAAADRYASTGYRRVGNSGLILPPISLGLWWNFGDNRPFDTQREVLRHAFDHGITHFDLANNYGPPYGSAEENFGRMLRGDFKAYRNELIISSKAGWDMWPGPYGDLGSRKYILARADESLARMGLDYVDIFYSHRVDPVNPDRGDHRRAGHARAPGQGPVRWHLLLLRRAHGRGRRVARSSGTPLVIHQPSYSMLNRWVEDGLLKTLEENGMGSIAFTPLAQGLLTNKYLTDEFATPSGGRDSLAGHLTEENLSKARNLARVASERGQSLAQLAVSWLLREGGVTSVLMGASSTAQLDENLGALENTSFTTEELDLIDRIVKGEAGIDHWRGASSS